MMKKWLIGVLVIALVVGMLPGTVIGAVFAAGESPHEQTLKEGEEHGKKMGALEGQLAGYEDYHAGRASNYAHVMPSATEISKRFSLNRNQSLYANAFIAAYRNAFQIAYNTAFREETVKSAGLPSEKGAEHGRILGEAEGRIQGVLDFYRGKPNNWFRAFSTYVADGSLESRYYLYREGQGYREQFLMGFRQGFMEAYIFTYQEKNMSTELRNKNAHRISFYADTLYFEEETPQFDLGEMNTTISTPIFMEVLEGTVYEPTYVAVYGVQNSFNAGNSKYKPVSSKYTVSIWNDKGSVLLEKPVKLIFNYHGSERAGVYQWIGGRWSYRYTTLSDGQLAIDLPAGPYSGGEYAIFIDDAFRYIPDISFNWAQKDIYTLQRRGVIADAVQFRPNAVMTRLELADMVYKAFSPTMPMQPTSRVIGDLIDCGDYKRAVAYAVSKNLMTLDGSGKFNPASPATYRDAETLMGTLSLRTVPWSELGMGMLRERYRRSPGLTNINAGMTRAEAAYMIRKMMP